MFILTPVFLMEAQHIPFSEKQEIRILKGIRFHIPFQSRSQLVELQAYTAIQF